MIRQKHYFVTFYRLRSCYRNINSSVTNGYHLCKHLKINENEAEHLSIKHPVVNKIDENTLKCLINTVQDLGYAREVLVEEPLMFGLLPITLKFRHQVLSECGFKNITPKLLLSYLTIMKQRLIGELKETELIPSLLNVENRLASYMTQWPTSLTSSVWGDINGLTLYSLRLQIMQKYLELMIDLTDIEFARGIKTYPTLKHRPLAVITETLNILQAQILIPVDKIKTNLYLVHGDPDNLKDILYKFRSIGGIDVREVIKMHPKIAMKNYNTLVEIRKILKEHGIKNEAQIRCFDIYTLSSSTVKARLDKAKDIPEFQTFLDHPRFLKMIHYNNTAMKRLQKLYSSNKKCLSLNILSGSTENYETFEKSPGDRLGKGKDLVFCISQSLGSKFKRSDIHKAIRKHPFWINIPLIQVKYVYEQLSTEFEPKDIFDNCSILLYPWSKVKKVLKKFNGKQTILKPSLHENLDLCKLSKSQLLSLALYTLEKDHYFTGNGVWIEEKNKNVAANT